LKKALLILALSLSLVGCQGPQAKSPDSGRAVEIVLEKVTARQYKNGKQRFEFRAEKLVLDEQTEKLEARQGVSGRLESGMWERRPN
jgi:hypothetical protein